MFMKPVQRMGLAIEKETIVMIPSKIEHRLEAFCRSDNRKALLLTGARQVGKR